MQLRLKESLKKKYIYSGLYGIPTLDLCDTGAALYQLNEQANWDQVVELVRYKPVEGWWVCNEPIQRPAPSWFVCLIGRALHRYRRGQGFESRTSLIFFQNFCVIHVHSVLMNLAGKWLCRIFASTFCKSPSWNAEFLHYPFVVDFLMNLAGKWLWRIFASRFCKCLGWDAEFPHFRICFFLQLFVLKKTKMFSHRNNLGLFWLRTLSSFLTVDV